LSEWHHARAKDTVYVRPYSNQKFDNSHAGLLKGLATINLVMDEFSYLSVLLSIIALLFARLR
jgi:hypothetical protein